MSQGTVKNGKKGPQTGRNEHVAGKKIEISLSQKWVGLVYAEYATGMVNGAYLYYAGFEKLALLIFNRKG